MSAESGMVVVIGAGIVGVSTAIWLRRAGCEVTLIDRTEPGQGTSFGNAGVLACCSIVPVTAPGLIQKGPRYLFDRNFPLFLRWSYLPRLAPWLVRYLSHANDNDTRRIANALTPIIADSVDQHRALADGGAAARFLSTSDYVFAYRDRPTYQANAYEWLLREAAGFTPTVLEGGAVREYDPGLGDTIGLLAVMQDHGYVTNPGAYVAELARQFEGMGGTLMTASVKDFDLSNGAVRSVLTDRGPVACDRVVVATGVWSKPLMTKLGLRVPLETERGYHVVLKQPSWVPKAPTMVASGKFVATPMEMGLRCAGIVEFGGLDAGPSRAPIELLMKTLHGTFPQLTYSASEEWLGHRPAPADSLPLIGEIKATGVYTAFGHHHVGLTGGAKTGRIIAGLVAGNRLNLDVSAYDPNRFQ